MTQLAQTTNTAIAIGERYGFEREKVELIKSQIAKDASDSELALFLYTAQRVGLDPLARQIYCIMRKDRGVEKMTIQTGIDGYRLIADRTGNYAPGRANTFEYDESGRLVSATAYVMKYVRGTWLEVSATAYWDEYVATFKDGNPMGLWGTKPRVMLGKCAEALALRRAFPAELSGIYTAEEMDAAGNDGPIVAEVIQPRQIVQEPDTAGIIDNILRLQEELIRYDPSIKPPTREVLATKPLDILEGYHTRLTDKIATFQKDDNELFDAEPEQVEPSEAEAAFWTRYGQTIGTTWQDVQRMLGRPYPRPTNDDEWKAADEVVNTRLNEEAAAAIG